MTSVNTKIGWGVIGAGGIADRRTIPGLLKANNAELKVFFDADAKRMPDLAKKYPMAQASANIDELLGNDAVSAVYIATPVHLHLGQITKAAEAGKHILVEKPVGLNAAEAEKALNICTKKGVKLGVGLMMRFGTLNQKMKEAVTAGTLGTIVSGHAQFSCWYPDMAGAWRQNPKLSGGGALIDLGVHSIDLIEYISGLKTIAVTAVIGTKTFKYASDDSAAVILELSNGAAAVSESNFNVPDAACFTPFELYGTGGSLRAYGTMAQDDGGEARIYAADPNAAYNAKQDQSKLEAHSLTGTMGNLYTREIESFSNAVLSGKDPEISALDGLHLAKVIDAAYKSSKTGKKIKIT